MSEVPLATAISRAPFRIGSVHRFPVPNFTFAKLHICQTSHFFIDAMCLPCRTKNPFLGQWVNDIPTCCPAGRPTRNEHVVHFLRLIAKTRFLSLIHLDLIEVLELFPDVVYTWSKKRILGGNESRQWSLAKKNFRPIIHDEQTVQDRNDTLHAGNHYAGVSSPEYRAQRTVLYTVCLKQ